MKFKGYAVVGAITGIMIGFGFVYGYNYIKQEMSKESYEQFATIHENVIVKDQLGAPVYIEVVGSGSGYPSKMKETLRKAAQDTVSSNNWLDVYGQPQKMMNQFELNVNSVSKDFKHSTMVVREPEGGWGAFMRAFGIIHLENKWDGVTYTIESKKPTSVVD